MENLYLFPNHASWSLLALTLMAMIFCYLAREPIHRALNTLSEGTSDGLVRVAEWAKAAAERMNEKNRQVLLEGGLVQAEQKIDHEFRRLESTYTKRLAAYPELHLKLDSNVARIEADYKECGQVPPEVPEWGEVVGAVAKLTGSANDRVIEKMLKEIYKSTEASNKKALQEYRTQTAKRHKVLGAMSPVLREVGKLLKKIDRTVTSVLDTTTRLDKYLTRSEEIAKGGAESIDMLSSKMIKLFIFSLIVIGVASAGAFINFQLIALPMAELVPAGSRILNLPVAQVAALVIVALETVVGIFLLEAIGITNIFPQITAMDRKHRRIILIVTLTSLFFLASVEASLAVLREFLVESEMTLKQTLAGVTTEAADARGSNLPVLGQATLGFVLPWILAMVAVPLEMVIESGQYVIVKLTTALVALFGHLVRILAFVLKHTLKLAGHLVDVFIAVPAKLGAYLKHRSEEQAVLEASSGKGAGT